MKGSNEAPRRGSGPQVSGGPRRGSGSTAGERRGSGASKPGERRLSSGADTQPLRKGSKSEPTTAKPNTTAGRKGSKVEPTDGRRSSAAITSAPPPDETVDEGGPKPSDLSQASGNKWAAGAAPKGPKQVKKAQDKKKKKKKKEGEDFITKWFKSMYLDIIDCFVGTPCFTFSVYGFSSDVGKYKGLFSSLGLTEAQVGVMFIFFRRIDIDDSGSISIFEMLDYLGLERNTFTKRVFSIFDEDGNGTIDFREFVISMWNYLTQSKSSLVLFSFDLYDKDSSGMLEVSEVEKMVQELYGKGAESNHHAVQILYELHEQAGVAYGTPGANALMSVNEFNAFARNHPAMLMPAFLVQDAMRRRICGVSFWERATDTRFKLSNGKYVPIGVLLETTVSDQMARSLVLHDAYSDSKKGGAKKGGRPQDSEAIHYMKNIGGILAARRKNNQAEEEAAVQRGTKLPGSSSSKVAPAAQEERPAEAEAQDDVSSFVVVEPPKPAPAPAPKPLPPTQAPQKSLIVAQASIHSTASTGARERERDRRR